MNFTYRLSYYLFGFLVGCTFLFFVLNQKNTRCSYFPNDRVLNNIKSKPFYYSEKASLTLAQKWVDTTDIKNTLTYGDVDFKKSNIAVKNGKLYTINGKTKANKPIILIIENYENKAILQEIIPIK